MELTNDIILNAISNGMKKGMIGIGKWLFNGVLYASYPVCLTISIISVILYIGGFKNSGKYASISIIIYFLLQALASVM